MDPDDAVLYVVDQEDLVVHQVLVRSAGTCGGTWGADGGPGNNNGPIKPFSTTNVVTAATFK